jgi:hypothetical protein
MTPADSATFSVLQRWTATLNGRSQNAAGVRKLGLTFRSEETGETVDGHMNPAFGTPVGLTESQLTDCLRKAQARKGTVSGQAPASKRLPSCNRLLGARPGRRRLRLWVEMPLTPF